jgi:hypothetical protein
VAGFCKVATVDAIQANGWGWVLTPERDVGTEARAADSGPFGEHVPERSAGRSAVGKETL